MWQLRVEVELESVVNVLQIRIVGIDIKHSLLNGWRNRVVHGNRAAIDWTENCQWSVAGIGDRLLPRHLTWPQDVVTLENILSDAMEPFSRDSNPRKQFVAHAKVVGKRIWPLKLPVERRKRDRAEVSGNIGEIDFATRREIHTAKLTLGDIVFVQIRPGRRGCYGGRICRIVKRRKVCGGSRLEAVEAEPNSSFSVAKQVIDQRGSRRECSPDRQMNIRKCRNVGKAPMLCGLS